ncbi:Pycsar system effector family protein [Streptomyces sp. NPDC056210]|uniref:Pycsar system effector family protein n=1 Tax=Streptomyces sp. NPDC056210 TaxID=3345746 RepID=UPI0035E1FD93
MRQAIDNGRLASTLADTDRDPAAALTADLTETSRIAARKHQWIRTGLIALCTGTALLPTPLLIG